MVRIDSGKAELGRKWVVVIVVVVVCCWLLCITNEDIMAYTKLTILYNDIHIGISCERAGGRASEIESCCYSWNAITITES